MSNFIGVIRNAQTKEVYATIYPGLDSELDNPCWLLLKRGGETVELIKLQRDVPTEQVTPTQIFLIAKDTPFTFPDPGNWDPTNNTVECIGSGGYGTSQGVSP